MSERDDVVAANAALARLLGYASLHELLDRNFWNEPRSAADRAGDSGKRPNTSRARSRTRKGKLRPRS